MFLIFFADICRSLNIFSLNVHIWNSCNCLSYIHILTHLEWFFENLLVAIEESTLCTAQNKVSSPIVQDVGEGYYQNILSITSPLDRLIILCPDVKHLLIKLHFSALGQGISRTKITPCPIYISLPLILTKVHIQYE